MSLLKRLEAAQIEQDPKSTPSDSFQLIKNKIHRKIVEKMTNEQQMAANKTELEPLVTEIVTMTLEEEGPSQRSEKNKIISEVLDELLGYGPIDHLLKDDSVSEIMVNSPNQVFVEKKGKLTLTDVKFNDNNHVLRIIEKIVAPLGRRIDESSPMVDARLPDGSRVNAIIPPLALKGPCITIRKFSQKPLAVEDLIHYGTMSKQMADFLKICVAGKLNLIVSGGTGSGKTTTLNLLSSFIPENERIVTIEDAAELRLQQNHVVTLETRPANIENKGAVTMRDLVKNSLRMRPDRIVIGEVRSGEALDMLQAMNTGHDGSLATAHANSPRDMLSRLETMVLMAGMDLPIRAIREQIASAVDLIVQQSRMRDGSRRITHLTEVQGMEGDIITLQDIFLFEASGMDQSGKIVGKIKPTGMRPKFLEKLISAGLTVDNEIFNPGF